MAYLKNRALFFTTSPRTPSKMIPEIQLLGEHFAGQKWNKQSQVEFIDLLAQSGLIIENTIIRRIKKNEIIFFGHIKYLPIINIE